MYLGDEDIKTLKKHPILNVNIVSDVLDVSKDEAKEVLNELEVHGMLKCIRSHDFHKQFNIWIWKDDSYRLKTKRIYITQLDVDILSYLLKNKEKWISIYELHGKYKTDLSYLLDRLAFLSSIFVICVDDDNFTVTIEFDYIKVVQQFIDVWKKLIDGYVFDDLPSDEEYEEALAKNEE